jgi:hypothetical protein
MHDLSAECDVRAPAGFALAFLATYLADQGVNAEGEASIRMRYPLRELFAGIVLERDVTVHVSYEPGPPGTTPGIRLGWSPEGTNMIPSFEGRIDARDTGEQTCRLTISGTYAPPLGVIGALFDRVVGVRIARGTLDGLLAEFKVRIEGDFLARIGMA